MIMPYFIWVFTVCKSTSLGVSRIQRLKSICIDGAKMRKRFRDKVLKIKVSYLKRDVGFKVLLGIW